MDIPEITDLISHLFTNIMPVLMMNDIFVMYNIDMTVSSKKRILKQKSSENIGETRRIRANPEVLDILNALPFYVLLVDEDHYIIEANAAVYK